MKSFKAFRWFSCIIVALVILFAGVISAHAATINVTANALDVLNGGNASCSLREAIQNINDGATTYADCAPTGDYGNSDTINIPAGTYTITIAGAGEYLNATGSYDILKSVFIVGAGAGSTTISGGGLDRVFHINPAGITPSGGGGVVVSISGVTITGGNSIGDGGGGIMINQCTLTVTNSTITGNTTVYYGGGIRNFMGILTVTNSFITSNSDTANYGNGGGIYSYSPSGTLTIANSTISGNTARNSGGIYSSGTLTVTNSTISGNSAPSGSGGGINSSGPVTIANSTISGNTASYRGGGLIYSGNSDTLTVNNSTISGNTASYGGGIYSDTGSYPVTNITNSTISGNTASLGGGIYHNAGTVTVANSIVANQTAGADCYNSTGTITSSGHNLESATSCGFTGTGDKHNANPMLGALADNGGPTLTMSLLSGSPAIDAGSCVQTIDQRGVTRPQGATCDIGAYELVSPNTTCTYSISPSNQTFTSGTGSITVTASASSCAWTATSSLSWVTITSGTSGTGSGTVTISVAANTTGASRTGTITIAGQTFTITQSAAAATTTDNCAATTSGPPGQIQIPFISYNSGYYSGVLKYQPANTTGIWFALEQFTQVSTPGCTTPATLSSGTLTIPKLTLTTSSGAVVNASVTLYSTDGVYYQVTSITSTASSSLIPPIAGALTVVKEGSFFDVNYNNGVTRYVNGVDQWRQHLGTDFKADPYTDVISISAGTAVYCNTVLNDPFNSAVIIKQSDGVQVVYGHIKSGLVMNTAAGNCGTVEKNQSLGYVQPENSSSTSYVPHIHMGYNTMGLALPAYVTNGQWGWGRAPYSTTRAEAENRGWVDINTFYNAPMQQ